jgi:RNA polymerase sigma-70 factor (ECF subfamily)
MQLKILRSGNHEKKLLCGTRDGSIFSFEALYKLYRRKIYGFSLKYLQNRAEAEDVVQSVFVNLWEHSKTLDENQPIKSYIFKATVNQIYNIYKRRAIRSKYIDYEQMRFDNFSNSTYDQVLYHDLENSINKIISTLPSQQQKIFILSRNKYFSHKEIAKKLDISVRTVENQIYRTLKIIRKELNINY